MRNWLVMINMMNTFLVVDVLRLAAGAMIFAVSLIIPVDVIPWYIFLLLLVYPSVWIAFKLLGFADESRRPWLPYIPCTADMAAFTLVFYITGTLNSMFILMFFFSVIMSSLNVNIRTGRYAMVISMIAVTGISVLVYLGVLPGVNILGGETSLSTIGLFVSLGSFYPMIILVQGLVFGLTRKISMSADELFAEKEILRIQHGIIERELEMARRIQRHLLPSGAPWPYVHSLYRPMHMVGGDFYDYIEFDGSGRAGIFISDVSGHGVAAALITTMIKTAIGQAVTMAGDPKEVMGFLNRSLHSHTRGNFVTAFYGIFDPATREIVYSCAGHNMPLVIAGESAWELEGARSIPLAMGDDAYLDSVNKRFTNETAELPRGCKLLLYTDGLSEATSPRDRSVMFENELVAHLVDIARLPGAEFVNELYSRLVRFRGSENFEDDVCFICVDIP